MFLVSLVMFTCKKVYAGIPFAHRQHRSNGHCALIHGHSWNIKIQFACHKLDDSGFVIDFGGLSVIEEYLKAHLDHAFVFNQDDEQVKKIVELFPNIMKPYVVPSCSCEGLAQHLWEVFDGKIRQLTDNRVFIQAVEIEENDKNSACYTP